jgi:hypothetical protein
MGWDRTCDIVANGHGPAVRPCIARWRCRPRRCAPRAAGEPRGSAQPIGQRRDHGIVRVRRAEELADPRAESRPESKMRVWLVLDGLHPIPQYWIEDSRGRLACADLAFPEQQVAVEYDGSWRDGQLWALNRDRTGSTGCRPLAGKSYLSPPPYLPTRTAWSTPSVPRSPAVGVDSVLGTDCSKWPRITAFCPQIAAKNARFSRVGSAHRAVRPPMKGW